MEPLPLPHPRHSEIAAFDLSPIGEVLWVTGSPGSGWWVDLGSAGGVRLPDRIRRPRIAAVDVDAAVVVDARTTSGAVNGWIVSADGIEAELFAGDATQDLIALPDGHIVATYFDEGFGKPVSEQGAAVFDHRGTLLTGYRRATGETFIDCYAAVGVGARPRPPSPEVHEVGVVRGPLRGLPGGRFLAESAHTIDGARHRVDGPALITMEPT